MRGPDWNGSGGEGAAAGRGVEAELLPVLFVLNSDAICYFHVICLALHVHYLLQYNPMRSVFVSLFPR